MNLLTLSLSYLRQRAFGTLLHVLILALGIATIVVLLVVSHGAEESLTRDARGVDLVVGAKGSPLQLILSAVYHVDAPTGNVPAREAEALMAHPAVAEAMPLALGDSYRGARIVGATPAYPAHFGAELARGTLWSGELEATVGATAARESGLDVGDTFQSAHGLSEGGHAHDEHPIRVVGVLAETGTVLDRLILTSIETVWEVHGAHGDEEDHAHGEEGEAHAADDREHADDDHAHHDDEEHAHEEDHAHEGDEARYDEEPESEPAVAASSPSGPPGLFGRPAGAPEREYTAVLLRYASPLAAVSFPRYVNTQTNLQAASPAFETARLFDLLGVGFDAVRAFGAVLVLVAVLSVFVALLGAMKERRYDLAVMRSLGASRGKLVALVLLEGLILAGLGALVGLFLGHLAAAALAGALAQDRGLSLDGFALVPGELGVVALALGAGAVAALVPAIQAYRTDIARVLARG